MPYLLNTVIYLPYLLNTVIYLPYLLNTVIKRCSNKLFSPFRKPDSRSEEELNGNRAFEKGEIIISNTMTSGKLAIKFPRSPGKFNR